MYFFERLNIKKLRKILFVIIAVCIAFFGVCQGYVYVLKKYVYPLSYKKQVLESSKEFFLDSALVYAVIKTESSFNQDAVSEKGAMGLMQITRPTADFIALRLGIGDYDLFQPSVNVRFGCYYLRYLIDRFQNLKTALCAYNAGEGNVRAWLKNVQYSLDGKSLYKIPFKETQEYIVKIEKSFTKYTKLYGKIVDNE